MTLRSPRRHPLPGAFLSVLFLLATSVRSAAQEDGPSMSDTVDFIRRSIEEHGDFRNIAGGGRLQLKLTSVLGRRLRVRKTMSDGSPGGPELHETSEFALADLDPEATHVRLWFVGDRLSYAVWLADSGKGGGVRVWPDGNEDMGAQIRPHGWIAVDDEALAQALVKAVNHAIALAGGHPRASADRFFGAPTTVRAVPATPVTGDVHHVVSLEDAEKLLRRRIRANPDSFATVAPGNLAKAPWTPVPLKGGVLLVTLPGTGSGFETNYLDAVRFDGLVPGKGHGLAALLEVTPDFIAAGVSSVRDGPLPCDLVQLPLTAAQLPPLDRKVPESTGVRLWTTAVDAWPDDEAGFLWLARSRDGAREWRVAMHSTRKLKEFGPESVKAAATELGLKPSEPLIDLLKSRAKAEKAARREAR